MGTKSLQRRQLRFARCSGWLALCVLPAVLGCDDDESGSLPGEIGNNHFFYGCSTIDDAHCRDGLTGFPEKIAVGGSFDLHARDDDNSSLSVRPVSPVMVTPSDGGFRFRRPGFGAFLAFDFSEFVDFAHIRAVDVDDILVLNSFGSSESELALTTNQRTTLTAVPLDEEEDVLAGSLVYRWVTDNEAVVEVEAVGTSVQVTAVGEGTAQLRVSLADEVSRVLQVVVRQGVIAPTDAGSGSPDASALDGSAPDADVPDGAAPTDGGTSTSDAGGETSVPTDAGDQPPIDAAASTESNTASADAALDGGQ